MCPNSQILIVFGQLDDLDLVPHCMLCLATFGAMPRDTRPGVPVAIESDTKHRTTIYSHHFMGRRTRDASIHGVA